MASPTTPLQRLRNLGVVAHIDAGKTTVSERILFFSGVEHRIGEVDEGTTVLDWMPEERERGITITAAATTLPWREHQINLVDTPGHVDFTVEVERCMRVLDGAILVIDAVAGVQAQSETVWRQMKKHRVPAICFVNKCDRAGADYLAAVASLKERLDAPAVAVQYPIYREDRLVGVIDLLARTAWEFAPDGSEPPQEVELPAELADEVGVLRSELVDTLAEEDETLLQLVLDDAEPELADLLSALRARVRDETLVPVYCGSALKNVGVQPLLDAVVEHLPSPLDVPPTEGLDPKTEKPIVCGPDPEGPLAALAFKLHADAHGDLTFVRVYSGTLRSGDQVWNPRTKRTERAARLLRMHAQSRQALEEARAGEIVALTGLKQTATGDTLCKKAEAVLLEPLSFPEPVISLVLEPMSTEDRGKLRTALERIAHEDPSFTQREDESTGQWLVSGMGELHLEVMLHRLEGEFRIEARMGTPRVAYREAVLKPGRGSGRIEKQIGTKTIFGAVDLEIEPAPHEVGIALEWGPDCAVPAGFREAVADALVLSAQVGPRFGFPLVQAKLRVVGGESRPGTDNELAFVQAAAAALRQAQAEISAELLEPWMVFEIESPADFTSGIIADLNARRAEVEGLGVQGALRSIRGRVPLIHMFGYSTTVRSLSQGRASFSMQPAGFAPVPDNELSERGLVWD